MKKTVTLHPQIQSGCSTVGSAPRSGRGGRKFESSHPDNICLKRIMGVPLSGGRIYQAEQIQQYTGGRLGINSKTASRFTCNSLSVHCNGTEVHACIQR